MARLETYNMALDGIMTLLPDDSYRGHETFSGPTAKEPALALNGLRTVSGVETLHYPALHQEESGVALDGLHTVVRRDTTGRIDYLFASGPSYL